MPGLSISQFPPTPKNPSTIQKPSNSYWLRHVLSLHLSLPLPLPLPDVQYNVQHTKTAWNPLGRGCDGRFVSRVIHSFGF